LSSRSGLRARLEFTANHVGLESVRIDIQTDQPVYSADFEITVQLLVQIDRLVQLIESPIFTCESSHSPRQQCLTRTRRSPPSTPRTGETPLPLQVPVWTLDASATKYCVWFVEESVERCKLDGLYSLKSSRVNICLQILAESLTFLVANSAVSTMASRSKPPIREEIKWGELLTHFRAVQTKHEKTRRGTLNLTLAGAQAQSGAQLQGQEAGFSIFSPSEKMSLGLNSSTGLGGASAGFAPSGVGASPTRPFVRRKVTNTPSGAGSLGPVPSTSATSGGVSGVFTTGDATIRPSQKGNGFLSAFAGAGASASGVAGKRVGSGVPK
jgi:hypothetical protein